MQSWFYTNVQFFNSIFTSVTSSIFALKPLRHEWPSSKNAVIVRRNAVIVLPTHIVYYIFPADVIN